VGIQDFGTMDPNASLKQVIDSLADLMDTLNFLLNGNLDVKNVRAKSITADRMNVQQLSAIAADLGKVVAGILIGAYISTSDGTYPRIDFSSVDRLLTAFNTANQYVSITPSTGGTPGITWEDNVGVGYITAAQSVGILMAAFYGQITLQSSNDITLNAQSHFINLKGSMKINDLSTYTGSFSTGTQTIVVNQGLITNVI
jgi:hypothetical protein